MTEGMFVSAYGGLPVNTVYGRNSATVMMMVSCSLDHAAIEVGPGVDPGVEKPSNTKRCKVGSVFVVAASAVIACVSKTNGGAVCVDSVVEDAGVACVGRVNTACYT